MVFLIEGEEMERTEILENVESLFEKAGFYLSQRCCARPSCFDFAARRGKQLAFVKVHPNIGKVYEKDADGLAILAELFSAMPLFVCEKTRSKPLEDDTVYSRYNVAAVTLWTLEDALLKGMEPLIEAGPGGCYVQLDKEAIRRKRLEKGLSIGRMAEVVGVSRRTLYGYERGMAKACVDTAYKLEWVLGIPVVKPIDISQYGKRREGFIAVAKHIIGESRFLQFVMKKLLKFNFTVCPLRTAPFDFVARDPRNETRLLGSVVDEDEPDFKVRAEEIVSLSKLLDAHPIFVTDSKRVSVEDIRLICREDLDRIKCAEDLMAKL